MLAGYGRSAPAEAKMSDHVGLMAIARRLGVSRNTVLAWHEAQGLLMYRRRIGPRSVWYTNDALLTAWEIARCKVELQARRERRRRRKLDL